MGEMPLSLLTSAGGDGAEVIYALRNKDTLANLILNELQSEGQNIRKAYQRRLPSNPSKDYYFMLRDTADAESLIIEYGFLDSKGDDVSQLKNNWRNYAEAVVRAIVEYLNLTYVPIEQGSYYTVKSGDSLWSIAKKFGVSVVDLKDANGLTSSMLNIGQTLKIPIKEENTATNNTYVVQKGDSLYKIARNYDTTVSELINLNKLTTTNLSVGQKLLIPTLIKQNSNNTMIYIVKSGDTLYKIAKDNSVTVDELININNLPSIQLSIGQQLQIPVVNTPETYIVKSGDTLYKIANEYNIKIDELKKLNNLNSNILSIGQILKLK